MLSTHSRMQCGPETFFFPRLARTGAADITAPHRWPAAAVEFVESLKIENESVRELFQLSTDEVEAYLRERPPAPSTVLESLTAQYAAKNGKTRWIEKTPRHLLHVDNIREAFPCAHIVRVVRDPRDVACSLTKVPWASDSILANMYRCLEDYRRTADFFTSDTCTITVRYEDLTARPEAELGRICRGIGEELEEDMIRGGDRHHLVTRSEPWKWTRPTTLDAGRRDAWKKELPSVLALPCEMLCHEMLEAFDYEHSSTPERTVYAFPWDRRVVEANEELTIQAAGCGVRILPLDRTNGRFWDDFCSEENVIVVGAVVRGTTRLEKGRWIWNLCKHLCRRRIRGLPCTRVDSKDTGRPERDTAERVAGWLIRATCRPGSIKRLFSRTDGSEGLEIRNG